MTHLDRFLTTLSTTVSETIIAYLVALIASGGDLISLAKIVLAIKLNVFALPLSWTPALQLPLWCWYVIAVVWIRQWFRVTGYETGEVVDQIEALVASPRTESSVDAVATDGGGRASDIEHSRECRECGYIPWGVS